MIVRLVNFVYEGLDYLFILLIKNKRLFIYFNCYNVEIYREDYY